VSFSSSEELQEAFRLANKTEKPLKMSIKHKECQTDTEDQAQLLAQRSVHTDVQCDKCGVFPIVGTRFQCVMCSDLDLCADCEALHPTFGSHVPTHAMLKLPINLDVTFEWYFETNTELASTNTATITTTATDPANATIPAKPEVEHKDVQATPSSATSETQTLSTMVSELSLTSSPVQPIVATPTSAAKIETFSGSFSVS
jgi:hypothetical protein